MNAQETQTEKKAVAKVPKKETSLALPAELDGSWGSEGFDHADILIPRLSLLQGQSQLVAEGEGKVGEIVKSTSKEVYGNGQNPLSIIPIMYWKDWTVEKFKEGRYQFNSLEKSLPDGSEREWTEKDGSKWRRNTNLNFFVLITQDVVREREAFEAMATKGQMPDLHAALMPCHLKFTRTSYNTGRQLLSFIQKVAMFKKPAASFMYKLGSKKVDGDTGAYQVFTIDPGEQTPVEYVATAKKWYDILRSSAAKVKIDDSEDLPTEPTSANVHEDLY